MKSQQSGFTLVEIAIVLVIIGLLLGGVLKGQELINSAKVKSLASEFRAIPTFIYGYQDRFRSLPGDDRDATRVGGTNATNGTRGNGVIEGAWDSENPGDESFLFWQHVRLANLAVGPTSYSGADAAAFIPRNAEGGRIGVTGTITIGGVAWNATFFACSGRLPVASRSSSIRRWMMARRTPEHCEYSAQSLPQALERSRPPRATPASAHRLRRVLSAYAPKKTRLGGFFFQSTLQASAFFHHRQPIGAAEQDDHIPFLEAKFIRRFQRPDVAPTHGTHRDAQTGTTDVTERAPDGARTRCHRHGMQADGLGFMYILLAVALPMEEAAQRLIAAAAHLAHPFEDAIDRHPDQHQRVRGEHHAGLKRFRNDFGRTGTAQAFHVGVVVGTHNNREIRLQFMHQMRDALAARASAKVTISTLARVTPAATSASRLQHHQTRRSHPRHRLRGRARVEIQCNIRHLLLGHEARQRRPLRPKPQMIACFSLPIDWAKILVSSIDRSSHSLLAKRGATRSL